MRNPIRSRSSQQSVTLSIHGLEDPMNAELEWQPSNAIAPEQQARLDRQIRKMLSDIASSDSMFWLPHS
jgi:hypothetical protein